MRTYSKRVLLRLTQDEAQRYIPPEGFEVHWSHWNAADKTVVVDFIVSKDVDVFPEANHDKQDVEIEIERSFKGKVLLEYPLQYNDVKKNVDIFLDDSILNAMPRGTRHSIIERHEIPKPVDFDLTQQMLDKRLGLYNRLNRSSFEVGKLRTHTKT
jgi:hypothetical protein